MTHETQAAFQAKVSEISVYLAGWKAIPQDEEAYNQTIITIQSAEGRQFTFRREWNDRQNKAEIFGRYPSGSNGERLPRRLYSEKEPRIGISLDRPAETLAKDIQRRFLPLFIQWWNEAQEQADKSRKRHELKIQRMKKLSAILGKDEPLDTSRDTMSISLYTEDGFYGHLQTSSGESFKIELSSLSHEQARRICQIIKEIS